MAAIIGGTVRHLNPQHLMFLGLSYGRLFLAILAGGAISGAYAAESDLPASSTPSPAATVVFTATPAPSAAALSTATITATPEESTEREEERLANEQGWVNFKAIQKVLQNDNLTAPAQRQQQAMQQSKVRRQQKNKSFYDIPTAENFWPFFSEFWLVKNVHLLQWDVDFPDYGIERHFSNLLRQLKMPPLKFKLLLLDSLNIFHMALPSGKGEGIFLLSVPFIRTLDLSQTEIALILLEDLVRQQQGFFTAYVQTPEALKRWGTNFQNNPKFKGKFIGEILQRYDELTMGTGFSFQQQYTVTKAMRDLLRDEDKLLFQYKGLLKKLDELVKTNPKFKNYLSIYPSPELQLGWLDPKPVQHIQ